MNFAAILKFLRGRRANKSASNHTGWILPPAGLADRPYETYGQSSRENSRKRTLADSSGMGEQAQDDATILAIRDQG